MLTRSLEATTICIFHRDHLPIWDLFSRDFVHLLEESFGFERVAPERDEKDHPSILTFARGYLDPDEPTGRRPVRSVTIDERRIEVVVSDPTGHAAVARFLEKFADAVGVVCDGDTDWLKRPQAQTWGTVWIGRLDIEPLHLLDRRVQKAVRAVQDGCRSDQCEPLLALKDLSCRLTFNITDPKLLESAIYFRDREFRLEPRFGLPADEHMWYASSPLRSDQHLAVLEDIEKAYAQNP